LPRSESGKTREKFTNAHQMSALRFLSIAARRVSPFAVTRRGYAEISDKLKLSMVLPHQVRCAPSSSCHHKLNNCSSQAIFNSTDVVQVNISSEAGDMGILANHVPSIEPLRPGVVEVIEAAGSKKWFGEQQP
jgi:F-type H+-transporting ATPase subunit delta